MRNTLNRSDLRIIGLCVLVMLVGLGFFISISQVIYSKPFKSDYLDKLISKQVANDYLAQRGWDVSEYQHSMVGHPTVGAPVFADYPEELPQEIGTSQWTYRWIKPGQKEEFKVYVSNYGRIAGYEHVIADTDSGASLPQTSAQALAGFYLATYHSWQQDEWELVHANTETRENRSDHFFQWNKTLSDTTGNTKLEITIRVLGDQIGHYKLNLYYDRSDWFNSHFELYDSFYAIQDVGAAILIVVLFLLLIHNLRRRDIRWRSYLIPGFIAGSGFLIVRINDIAGLATFRPDYSSNPLLLIEHISLSLLFSFFIVIATVLLMATVEPGYRDNLPGMTALRHLFTKKFLRSKSFFVGSIVGVALAVIIMLNTHFTTFIYAPSFDWWKFWYLDRTGAWSYSAIIPLAEIWFQKQGINLGMELVLRLGLMAWLFRITHRKFIAIFVVAILGLFPIITEFTPNVYIYSFHFLINLLLGWVFFRFGVFACFLGIFGGQMLLNASLSLTQIDNGYYISSGLIPIAILIIPSCLAFVEYLRYGSFASDDQLVNALDNEIKIDSLRKGETARKVPKIFSLGKLRNQILNILLPVAVLCVLIAFLIGPLWSPSYMRVKTTYDAAVESALQYLKEDGQNVDKIIWVGHTNSTMLSTWKLARVPTPAIPEHLMDVGGKDMLEQVYSEHISPTEWWVRFYRPDDHTHEYTIYIDGQDSSVLGFYYSFASDTATPSISQEQAMNLVSAGITQKGYNLSNFDTLLVEQIDKPHRSDHHFRFQANTEHPIITTEAPLLIETSVRGNHIGWFRVKARLPSTWSTLDSRFQLPSVIKVYYRATFLFCFTLIWLFALLPVIRNEKVHWKPVLILFAGQYLFILLEHINTISISGLPENPQWSNMLGGLIVQILPLIAWTYATIASWPELLQDFSKPTRFSYQKDAMRSILITLGALALFEIILALLVRVSPDWLPLRSFAIPILTTRFPAFTLFTSIVYGLTDVFILMGLIYIHKRFTSRWRYGSVLIILPASLLVLLGIPDITILAWQDYLINGLQLIFLLLLLRYIWWGNPWSILYGIIIFLHAEDVLIYFQVAANNMYQLQGYIAISLLALIPLIFWAEAWWRSRGAVAGIGD